MKFFGEWSFQLEVAKPSEEVIRDLVSQVEPRQRGHFDYSSQGVFCGHVDDLTGDFVLKRNTSSSKWSWMRGRILAEGKQTRIEATLDKPTSFFVVYLSVSSIAGFFLLEFLVNWIRNPENGEFLSACFLTCFMIVVFSGIMGYVILIQYLMLSTYRQDLSRLVGADGRPRHR